MNKAIFLDRDGVVNNLIYHQEHGIIDSPFTVDQFELKPNVAAAISALHEKGYLVILVSNQPGIAKQHHSPRVFDAIREKMTEGLRQDGASLDGEYYCLHHPEATVERYREICECRKPKPGMLLQAARDHDIDLAASWMIGDGLTDVQAGKAAGVKTVLIAKMKCELCAMMEEMDARPDHVCATLAEAAKIV